MTDLKASTNKNPAFSTQRYLRIGEIHDDVITLKNGSLRAVLEVSPVNMNLKSEDEQQAMLMGYQGFLNALDFPVQIVVRSKKLDIAAYTERTRALAQAQKNELLKNMTLEYAEYVHRLVEFADIMEKHFYVIVGADPVKTQVDKSMFHKFMDFIHPGDTREAFRTRKREFGERVKTLNSRADTTTASLSSIGLSVRRLPTQELITLFYEIYNPDTARTQHVTDTDAYQLASHIV